MEDGLVFHGEAKQIVWICLEGMETPFDVPHAPPLERGKEAFICFLNELLVGVVMLTHEASSLEVGNDDCGLGRALDNRDATRAPSVGKHPPCAIPERHRS